MDKKIFFLLVFIIIILHLNYYKCNLNDKYNYELFTLKEDLATFRNISDANSYEITLGQRHLKLTRDNLKLRLDINDTEHKYNNTIESNNYIYEYNTLNKNNEKELLKYKNKYKLFTTEDVLKNITEYRFYNDSLLQAFDNYIKKKYYDKNNKILNDKLTNLRKNIINGISDEIIGDPYIVYYSGSSILISHVEKKYHDYQKYKTDELIYISDPELDASININNIKEYRKNYTYFTTKDKRQGISQIYKKYIFYDPSFLLTIFDIYLSLHPP